MAENTSTGDYVKAPETVPPEVPVEDQLNQLKIAAKGKINEFVDKANQAANDPANKPDGGKLQRDVDATAQDATNSYTKALNQLGEAFTTLETTGKQIAGQLGTATGETAAGAQGLNVAAREHAQQRSADARQKVQGGQSAVQQGIAKVHDALSSGIAVANQKLQEGGATTTTASKDLNTQSPSTLFQSLGNVISSTAQSVKDAFVTPSPTANQSHATPTSTNLPVTHPPAQSISESVGQTAAALRDAVKSTWSSPAQTGTPVKDTSNKSLPGDSGTE